MPLLPAAGKGPKVAIGPDEVAGFLTLVFNRVGIPKSSYSNIASHSLKPTLLAVCAKFGLDMTSRQLLGYHVVSGQYSALNYGRDNLAGPIDRLVEILQQVREGTFVPDAERGNRWVENGAIPIEVQISKVFDLSALYERLRGNLVFDESFEELYGASLTEPPAAGSSGEGRGTTTPPLDAESDPESEFAGAEDVEAPPQTQQEEDQTAVELLGDVPSSADALLVVRHCTRLIVHYLAVADRTRTMCGKVVTDSFEAWDLGKGSWPACRSCFGTC